MRSAPAPHRCRTDLSHLQHIRWQHSQPGEQVSTLARIMYIDVLQASLISSVLAGSVCGQVVRLLEQ